MKKLFLLTLLLISGITLFAQETEFKPEKEALNNISLNFGGGTELSANYERLYYLTSNFFLAGQIGIGYCTKYDEQTGESIENFLVLPHHFTGNIGKKRSYFEFGLSSALVLGDVKKPYPIGPLIGYRHHPLKAKRVGFRVYFNFPVSVLGKDFNPFWPEFDFEFGYQYVPLGFCIGYKF